MKRLIWLEGWMNLESGELNLSLSTYHKKEDRIIFQKILKKVKKTWKKAFRDMKEIYDIDLNIPEGGKLSPEARNNYRIYICGNEKGKKSKEIIQKGGYNEY
ncbi:MAG: hypothetical protein PHH35_01590 [Candidatus Pacebacteria bacterium]|jgi:hypothetical protein|nr:hypothetical protein [Candidatus Paceibacterota bacterium]